MNNAPQHRRRVGTVRPSHLMFTGGIGALVDLPNFSVLVNGIDDWRYTQAYTPLTEPRLLQAIQTLLRDRGVVELRPAPWIPGIDDNPSGEAARVGVPVTPFPQWLRCTACNELGAYHPSVWTFVNDKPRRPDQALFFHNRCPSKRSKPLAVPARFLLACTNGHLDDFPYPEFVHRGGACTAAPKPRLIMRDFGGNLGANVQLECHSCGTAKRNISDAMGLRGPENLPACRGRHPHLKTFGRCDQQARLLVAGASNQWFPQTLSALAVPKPAADRLDEEVERQWHNLVDIPSAAMLTTMRAMPAMNGVFAPLRDFTDADIYAAIERRRAAADTDTDQPVGYPDLLTPEWQIFTAPQLPEATLDFTVRRDPAGLLDLPSRLFSDVLQVERLREVRALAGFTRLDAPDPDDPGLVTRVSLGRGNPTWVPASEVRGEGIFLRIDEDLISDWGNRVTDSAALHAHRDAYQRFRHNRYSDRITADFDPLYAWPGARYIALHTLSHLLIRTIALECGYSSASLSERIYSASGDDPRAGILIYTAVPDAEGTLGGLVSLAEPAALRQLLDRALTDATRCSSDPLCGERLPQAPADFLHGAACHVCLFVSETTCERGNRYLDRRFVVAIDDPKLALAPDL
ncbi:DUF1998 domain-containing protein [Pilimelia columellifera]|uniref:DUF1998 domain-containing protein n=1 Tax=Pilimelia columellifera subsp. columellifera TaxID=706583 RepID=A0ABN3NHP1_9ACTN